MNELQRVLMQPIYEYVDKKIAEWFTKGDGISHITALGTVTADYAGGKPKVKFDRDASASGKVYAHLAAYSPAANDRVVLLRVGRSWVVLGKVVE